VFILKVLKVLCFDTLLQVFILKVDSGPAGALVEFVGLRILLQGSFPGNVGGKGVRWLAGYFMGYYTTWLAPVKRNFGSILGNSTNERSCIRSGTAFLLGNVPSDGITKSASHEPSKMLVL
jgi:hypothetical protein